MHSHLQVHMINEEKLKAEIVNNIVFASNNKININVNYSVPPHYSGK